MAIVYIRKLSNFNQFPVLVSLTCRHTKTTIRLIYSKNMFVSIPALGDDGGDRKAFEEPARRAEYNTESTVVIIPRTRVLVVTAFDLLCRPLQT